MINVKTSSGSVERPNGKTAEESLISLETDINKYVRSVIFTTATKLAIVLDTKKTNKGSLLIQGSNNCDPLLTYIYWNTGVPSPNIHNIVGTAYAMNIKYDASSERVKIVMYSSSWSIFLVHSSAPILDMYTTDTE